MTKKSIREIRRNAQKKVKQTIIVKKSHPKVNNRIDAEKIAKQYADRIYTSRETSTSFRFRQRSPSDFIKESFQTEKKTKYVSIVWGRLKGGE